MPVTIRARGLLVSWVMSSSLRLVLLVERGDNEAGGDGDDEGGDLTDQAVADGELGEDVEAGAEVPLVFEDADGETAEDVDDGDDDAGDGVAADELGGTVHGSVEVGFGSDGLTAAAGFVFVDEAGVEVGVDGHLLAGHAVQGEAGGDFADAGGAFGDDDELDDDEDEEDDEADGEGVGGDEVAKGFDDATGGGGAARAVFAGSEDETGGGAVEDEAEQGGSQKHRRENRQLHGAVDVDGGE